MLECRCLLCGHFVSCVDGCGPGSRHAAPFSSACSGRDNAAWLDRRARAIAGESAQTRSSVRLGPNLGALSKPWVGLRPGVCGCQMCMGLLVTHNLQVCSSNPLLVNYFGLRTSLSAACESAARLGTPHGVTSAHRVCQNTQHTAAHAVHVIVNVLQDCNCMLHCSSCLRGLATSVLQCRRRMCDACNATVRPVLSTISEPEG